MIRWFAASLLALSIGMPTFAQQRVDEITLLQQRIDSLTAVQSGLTRQLNAVTLELKSAKENLLRLQHEQVDSTGFIVMTNMEASLRSSPSPGARVLRLIPEATPLTALDYEGAYWKVQYQELEGWVMRLFVDEDDEAQAFKDVVAKNGTDDQVVEPAREYPNRRAQRIGKNLLITDFGIHPPNSAGGISMYYAFEHLDSTRTIREITLSVTPYNADGFVEKGKNSGVSTRRLRRFGPISVFDGERKYQVDNVWYNDRIQCAQIDRIDVVFTDGSRMSHRNDLSQLIVESIPNSCLVQPLEQDKIVVEEQY